MKAPWELRSEFTLQNYGTAISRDDFDRSFTKTKERIEFTFGGWDGKSYDGETRTAYIYHTNIPGYEHHRFIKVGKSVHYITDTQVTEKVTGEKHPLVNWLVDVLYR